ncbi:type II secretion system protein GspK [Stenotrophomonas sp. SY1]|jgi:general secretion pathway protein K|uniref:general secretion pathway protein GspK n=1 Tax=Stenotrophomonas sp. SY1 TaxID=477235 RepID=UPI001E4C3441|nr:type II secretion system protein GspK [Stenotrophomonas sp. SY1]MCD9085933.1 type II secretion system protein GspK [Stenotrophomonas sp. SY1]
MRMRGAALVLVLWLIALLAATIGAFALSARVEYMQGRVSADLGAGEQLAHAGIDYALSRMRATPTQPSWRADGRRYRWQFAEQVVDLNIVDESGKVDLNQADRPLLEALLRALAVEPARATQVAGAILDWRDPDDLRQPTGGAESADYQAAGYPYGASNGRFDSIGELQRLLGMDAALYARLAPQVTVWGGSRPDARFAAAPVLTALGMDAALVIAQREREDAAGVIGQTAPMAGTSGAGTYSVRSQVQMGNGRVAVLRSVVRLAPEGASGAPYTVLRWEQGAVSR